MKHSSSRRSSVSRRQFVDEYRRSFFTKRSELLKRVPCVACLCAPTGKHGWPCLKLPRNWRNGRKYTGNTHVSPATSIKVNVDGRTFIISGSQIDDLGLTSPLIWPANWIATSSGTPQRVVRTVTMSFFLTAKLRSLSPCLLINPLNHPSPPFFGL